MPLARERRLDEREQVVSVGHPNLRPATEHQLGHQALGATRKGGRRGRVAALAAGTVHQLDNFLNKDFSFWYKYDGNYVYYLDGPDGVVNEDVLAE